MQDKLDKKFLYSALAVIAIMLAAFLIVHYLGKATDVDNSKIEEVAKTKITEMTDFSEEKFKELNHSSMSYDKMIRLDTVKDIYYKAQENYINNTEISNRVDIKSFNQNPFNGNLVLWKADDIKVNKIEETGNNNYRVDFDLTLDASTIETIPGDRLIEGTTRMNSKLRFRDLSMIINSETQEISVPKETLDKLGQFSLMWDRSQRVEPINEEIEYVEQD